MTGSVYALPTHPDCAEEMNMPPGTAARYMRAPKADKVASKAILSACHSHNMASYSIE
jgi:hypothetical protein